MILYTIIPAAFIFETEESAGGIVDNTVKEVEISRGRVRLQAQLLPGGELKILRIISTDPLDYLKPEWQPGTIIPLI